MRAGMGSDAAEAVLCKYPTPRSLFEAYRGVRRVAEERNVNPVLCATKARFPVTRSGSACIWHIGAGLVLCIRSMPGLKVMVLQWDLCMIAYLAYRLFLMPGC